ncbi:unnamed protein product [Microthlaspi erraticum]|uniref:Retrotransposon gag domain-containing protein n=2 Tax=Microthlaspi erraticum TaxID=1685480 RepID=A0A6D2INZ9_9BRAS|nr:unnamed protein product [Microthlaspi erraticum]
MAAGDDTAPTETPTVTVAQLEALTAQMKQNEERLAQIQAENATLRAENASLAQARNRYRDRFPPMQSFDTPPLTGATGATLGQELPTLRKRLEAMELLLARLPGVAPPITKSAPNCYADTPFTDAIALVEMPKKFIVPSMKMYDGTTDPDNHIAQYKQRMFTTAIAKEYREASMCKGFGSSLTGPALQWFTNLPNASIDSFASLTDRFVEQFASSRNIERTADDLYEVIQKRGEPLRDYVGRFNKEKVSIPACVTSTAISAFKRGLLPDSDLYKELTKYQCRTMEDVLSRAWAQIRNERPSRDDRPYQRPRSESTSKRSDRSDHRPLNQIESDQRSSSTWPDMSNLAISPAELVNVLNHISGVRWPQKMKAPGERRDTSKWCDFHSDHGHRTEDCITLRMEVNELLKKGHLREYLSDRARSRIDDRSNDEVQRKPSPAQSPSMIESST